MTRLKPAHLSSPFSIQERRNTSLSTYSAAPTEVSLDSLAPLMLDAQQFVGSNHVHARTARKASPFRARRMRRFAATPRMVLHHPRKLSRTWRIGLSTLVSANLR